MIEPPAPSPQVAAYLASLPALPPAWTPPIEARRSEQKTLILARSGPPQEVAYVEDVDAGGVRARLYQPAGGETAVFVWFHGGGWMFNDIDTYDPLTRAFANAAGSAVLAVDYRRAPEHRFPAALDDAWSAVRWAEARFDHTAIGGDSAGANLAAAVTLRAREASMEVVLQVLAYPILDYRVDTDAYYRHRERYEDFAGIAGYGATFQDGIRWLWTQYLANPAQQTNPEAVPLQASSLAGVAPALILTAEHDILRPEGEEYAKRLAEAGVLVELREFSGQIHGFLDGLGVLEDAVVAVEEIGAALRKSCP
jgi:acetyl esterase